MPISFAQDAIGVPNGFHQILHDLGKEVCDPNKLGILEMMLTKYGYKCYNDKQWPCFATCNDSAHRLRAYDIIGANYEQQQVGANGADRRQ